MSHELEPEASDMLEELVSFTKVEIYEIAW